MKKNGIIILFLLCFGLNAQKTVDKVFSVSKTTFFQIDAEDCFEIKLKTHDSDEAHVMALIEGEYQNDIVITSKNEGTTFFLGTKFHSSFNNPNDKLSAHKVVSVYIEITIPKNRSVKLVGESTKMTITGDYNDIELLNIDENIILDEVEGNILVKSISGHIFLNVNSGKVVANSKFGNVNSGTVLEGESKFLLNTVNGNIYINKEE